MKLTPTAEAIGTVPRHFAVRRTITRNVAPPTFGMYKPGGLYPGEYEIDRTEVVEGADQSTLTDYSGETRQVGQ